MSDFSARYWLNFEGSCAHQPVICNMAREHPDTTFNIKQANVAGDSGIIAVQLSGSDESVHAAVHWLEEQGVRVEPVELQTIEG